jgi:DNA-binding response OmpR family regulator
MRRRDHGIRSTKGSGMSTILVYSDDTRFGKTCANELKSEGYLPYVFTTEEGVVDFFKQRSVVDLVILNEGAEKPTSHHLLEVLREMRPKVSVIMTSEYFNFWNDFSTWLADACLVNTPDLAELKETVKTFLSQPPGSQERLSSGTYSVDWA